MKHHLFATLLKTACFSLCFNHLAQAEIIKATQLKEMPYTQADIQQICKLFSDGCYWEEGSLKLYQNNQDIYFIDESSKIALLEKKKHYKVKQIWNFNQYKSKKDFFISIKPVLYPLNKTEKAIALSYQKINDKEKKEWADFIVLQDNGKYRTALKDIFFYQALYQYKCETEAQSHNNPHCHDESKTTLSIQYHDDGQPYYQWGLSYTTIIWKAGVSDKMKTKEVSPVKWVRPFEK